MEIIMGTFQAYLLFPHKGGKSRGHVRVVPLLTLQTPAGVGIGRVLTRFQISSDVCYSNSFSVVLYLRASMLMHTHTRAHTCADTSIKQPDASWPESPAVKLLPR